MRKFPLTQKALYLTFAVMILTLSLPRAVFSQASTTTTNIFVPFGSAIFVPCANGGAGEDVLILGNFHVLMHSTVNQNRSIIKIHFQLQGTSGIGMITGDLYRASAVSQSIDSSSVSELAGTFTLIENSRIVAEGVDNNFQIHQNIHMTLNANGEVISTVSNVSVKCN